MKKKSGRQIGLIIFAWLENKIQNPIVGRFVSIAGNSIHPFKINQSSNVM
mgnify:CR=1 FL=1